MPEETSAPLPVRPTLRIWEPPPVFRQLPLPLRPAPLAPPRPPTARAKINGRVQWLRHWSRDQWERTPEAERPRVAIRDDQGGRFAIEAEGNE